MKTTFSYAIIGLCIVDVLCQTPNQWAAILASRGICQMKTSVQDGEVQKVRNWDFGSNDDQLKKYVFCVYRQLQLMDNNGNLNKDFAQTVLPEESDRGKFLAAAEACKNEAGSDRYEKAYNFVKCYNQQNPKDIVVL